MPLAALDRVALLLALDRRNALDRAMWSELEARVHEVAASKARAAVLTGAGEKAFCAGMDLRPDNPLIADLMSAVGKAGDPEPAAEMLRFVTKASRALARLPIPTVAAVGGQAHGGGAELAVICDLRVMDPEAIICFSEVRLGLMPDIGGGVALTRLIGPSRAAEVILTAREVSAADALELGIVNRVAAPGEALAEAMELAGAIARNGPRAVRAALEVIRKTPALDEEAALELELELAAQLIGSGEAAHGVSALFAKKAPEFPDP